MSDDEPVRISDSETMQRALAELLDEDEEAS